jgi:hypothetical protein
LRCGPNSSTPRNHFPPKGRVPHVAQSTAGPGTHERQPVLGCDSLATSPGALDPPQMSADPNGAAHTTTRTLKMPNGDLMTVTQQGRTTTTTITRNGVLLSRTRSLPTGDAIVQMRIGHRVLTMPVRPGLLVAVEGKKYGKLTRAGFDELWAGASWAPAASDPEWAGRPALPTLGALKDEGPAVAADGDSGWDWDPEWGDEPDLSEYLDFGDDDGWDDAEDEGSICCPRELWRVSYAAVLTSATAVTAASACYVSGVWTMGASCYIAGTVFAAMMNWYIDVIWDYAVCYTQCRLVADDEPALKVRLEPVLRWGAR